MPSPSSDVLAALRQQLAAAGVVPEGYAVEDLRLAAFEGVVEPLTGTAGEQQALTAAREAARLAGKSELAAGPDPITDGRPTYMRVVAWMVHEGRNRNGDAFVKEELPAAAARIDVRHPLVMDWNHAAILGGPGRVIGYWHKADYAFDQKAADGQGRWGILVEGVMFAWAFPDIADTMLAEQSRHGKIDFSMACIPSSVEFGTVDGKHAAILHNPVFFTHSALDVPPGDPDATGAAAEDTAGANRADVEDALRRQVASAAATTQETQMKIVIACDVRTAASTDAKQVFDIVAKNEAGEVVAQSELAVEFSQAAELATAQQERAEAQAKITELETAITAGITAREEFERNITELTEALGIKTQALADFEAQAAERAKAERLAARKTTLPATYLAAHDALDETERATVEARWADLSDEAWTEKLADITRAAGGKKGGVDYRARSEREGFVGATLEESRRSIADRVAALVK